MVFTQGSNDDSPESSLFPSPVSGWITAYCDGGSRGNPGPAGFGVYIQDDSGKVLAELSEYLGVQTNNYAEYSGLIAAIEFAIAQGRSRLRVISDSELMVKQMKGLYRVKSPELRPLYDQAKRLASQLEAFEIRHVLREKNHNADRLANLAMDRGMRKTSPPPPSRPPASRMPAAGAKMLRGLTKGGVVHLLGDELPDGIFVKIIPE